MKRESVRSVFLRAMGIHHIYSTGKYGLIIFGTLWLEQLVAGHPTWVFRCCVAGIALILLEKLMRFESKHFAVYCLCRGYKPENKEAFDIEDVLRGGGADDMCVLKRRSISPR